MLLYTGDARVLRLCSHESERWHALYRCDDRSIASAEEHNAGKTRSLKQRRPLVLIYREMYQTKAGALARERYFKTPEGGALKQGLVAQALRRK